MRVLLFGGTFDPPHNGHINNLKAAMALVKPDRVVVMPAGTPPHKTASATPAEIRLEMCACFRALGPCVEISDWEIAQGGKSYTVNTLHMLSERFSGAELFLSVGSDMLLTFREWKNWQEILRLATLVVESREDGDGVRLSEQAQALAAEGGRVLLCRAHALELASRDIRAGLAGAEALPAGVAEIIEKYRLYENAER